MTHTIFRISVSIIASVVVVASLFAVSDRMVHRHNPFLRQFPPHALTALDTIDIGFNSYYVAGSTDSVVYLGNTTSPLRILSINLHSAEVNLHAISIDSITHMKFWAPTVKVLYPHFFFADGAVPVLYKGNVDDWHATKSSYNDAYFTLFTPIDSNVIATRSVSAVNNQYVLGRKNLDQSGINLSDSLLKKQLDGRFCVDGMLLFDHLTSRIVYLYYYRNQFIVTDENLHLAMSGTTIDTVSTAQIELASIQSGTTITHAAPPLFVNKQSAVSNGLLFINSALMARNENRNTFDSNAVVDVYNLGDATYSFSFYLPNIFDERMHDFRIAGNRLLTLNGNHVTVYHLTEKYFKDIYM